MPFTTLLQCICGGSNQHLIGVAELSDENLSEEQLEERLEKLLERGEVTSKRSLVMLTDPEGVELIANLRKALGQAMRSENRPLAKRVAKTLDNVLNAEGVLAQRYSESRGLAQEVRSALDDYRKWLGDSDCDQ